MRSGLYAWADAFRHSLEHADAAGFLSLFTDDASFQASPFEPPLRGRDLRRAIDEYRLRGGNEWNVDVWADVDDIGILNWSTPTSAAPGRRMLGNGILVVRFGRGGRCSQARQWHHWHLADAPPASGFVENPLP